MDKNDSNAVCLVICNLEAAKILHPKDNLVCRSAAIAHLGVMQINKKPAWQATAIYYLEPLCQLLDWSASESSDRLSC